jgi:hypothetical protein
VKRASKRSVLIGFSCWFCPVQLLRAPLASLCFYLLTPTLNRSLLVVSSVQVLVDGFDAPHSLLLPADGEQVRCRLPAALFLLGLLRGMDHVTRKVRLLRPIATKYLPLPCHWATCSLLRQSMRANMTMLLVALPLRSDINLKALASKPTFAAWLAMRPELVIISV